MSLVSIQELETVHRNRDNKGTGSGRKAQKTQKAGICFGKGVSESGEMSAVRCGGGSKRRRKGEMIHSTCKDFR